MKQIKKRGRPKSIHKNVVKLLKGISKKMATQSDLDAKEAEVLAAVQKLSDLVAAGPTDTAPTIALLQQILDPLNALIEKLQTPPAPPTA